MPRLGFIAVPLLLVANAALAAPPDPGDDTDMRRALVRAGRLLLREELRGNCAGLTVTTKTHIDRLRELQARVRQESEGPPATVLGQRPAAEDYARERDRVEALNVVLDAKGCMPVNIEQELHKPQTAPASGDGKRSRAEHEMLEGSAAAAK